MAKTTDTKIMPICSDVIFKAVFAKNHDILQKMVCDIIGFKDKVKSFEVYTGEEILPNYKDDRKYVTDMIVVINKYIKVNIEINRYDEEDLEARNIMYFSRLIEKVDAGTSYKELANIRAYQINFNDFEKSKSNATSEYAYQDKYPPYRRLKFVRIFNHNIVKCLRLVYNSNCNDMTMSIRWAAFVKSDDISIIDKILGGDMLMKEQKDRLLKTINSINHDNNIVQAWAVEENYRLKEMSQLQTAENKGIRKGKKEGFKEGKHEGIKEGIKEGITKGINNVIHNMLNHNMDYETIAMATDMPINEITKIAKKMDV